MASANQALVDAKANLRRAPGPDALQTWLDTKVKQGSQAVWHVIQELRNSETAWAVLEQHLRKVAAINPSLQLSEEAHYDFHTAANTITIDSRKADAEWQLFFDFLYETCNVLHQQDYLHLPPKRTLTNLRNRADGLCQIEANAAETFGTLLLGLDGVGVCQPQMMADRTTGKHLKAHKSLAKSGMSWETFMRTSPHDPNAPAGQPGRMDTASQKLFEDISGSGYGIGRLIEEAFRTVLGTDMVLSTTCVSYVLEIKTHEIGSNDTQVFMQAVIFTVEYMNDLNRAVHQRLEEAGLIANRPLRDVTLADFETNAAAGGIYSFVNFVDTYYRTNAQNRDLKNDPLCGDAFTQWKKDHGLLDAPSD